MSKFLERLYAGLIICVYKNQHILGSLSRICLTTSDGPKQRYFIYCPNGEIFITSIFQFGGKLQINLHPNLSDYIWSDRICDYIDGIAKQTLVTGYEISRLSTSKFPMVIATLNSLIQLSRTSPELGDACACLWGKNCFPQHTPYTHDYDSLFV